MQHEDSPISRIAEARNAIYTALKEVTQEILFISSALIAVYDSSIFYRSRLYPVL